MFIIYSLANVELTKIKTLNYHLLYYTFSLELS